MICKSIADYLLLVNKNREHARVICQDKPGVFEFPADLTILVFVLAGKVQVISPGKTCNPDDSCYAVVHDNGTTRINISTGAKVILALYPKGLGLGKALEPHVDFLTGRRSFVTPSVRTFLFKMEKALQFSFDDESWLEAELASLQQIVQGVLQSAVDQMNKIPAGKEATRKALYNKLCHARDFMDAHLADNLSITTIAREASLSEFHFSRLFRKVFDKTPYQYIKEQKTFRALEILAGDAPIVSINEAIGFESVHSFSSFCKDNTGLSPRELRKEYNLFMEKLAGLENHSKK